MKKYDKTVLLEKWSKGYKLLVENQDDPEKFKMMCLVMEKIEDQLRDIGITDKDWAATRGVETFTSGIDRPEGKE